MDRCLRTLGSLSSRPGGKNQRRVFSLTTSPIWLYHHSICRCSTWPKQKRCSSVRGATIVWSAESNDRGRQERESSRACVKAPRAPYVRGRFRVRAPERGARAHPTSVHTLEATLRKLGPSNGPRSENFQLPNTYISCQKRKGETEGDLKYGSIM